MGTLLSALTLVVLDLKSGGAESFNMEVIPKDPGLDLSYSATIRPCSQLFLMKVIYLLSSKPTVL